MLFRRDPDMPIAPSTQVTELLYLWMYMLNVILDWKPGRVVDTDITTKPEEDAGGFKREQTGVRPK